MPSLKCCHSNGAIFPFTQPADSIEKIIIATANKQTNNLPGRYFTPRESTFPTSLTENRLVDDSTPSSENQLPVASHLLQEASALFQGGAVLLSIFHLTLIQTLIRLAVCSSSSESMEDIFVKGNPSFNRVRRYNQPEWSLLNRLPFPFMCRPRL